MTSRITIEVDFDNGQPYIKIVNDTTSDDVRDKLIKFFTERLQHTSSWCKITHAYDTGMSTPEGRHAKLVAWRIDPITPAQMADEAKAMQEQAEMLAKCPEQPSLSH